MTKFSQLKSKILIILVILLCIFSLNFFQKEIKSLFYFISSPIQKTFWQVGNSIADFSKTIFEIKNLKKDIELFKVKNQELLFENVQLKELKRENEILRKVLNLGLQNDFKLDMAEVIARDVFQDFILINKGKNSNFASGMPVLTEGKIILGKIFEVYDNFSKVMLISDKLSSFDAKISEKDIYGIVKGEGNLSIIFDLIPQDKEIKNGDLVVTSSLGGIFPKGLLVGEIKEVKKSDIKPYQKAVLTPLFNLNDLEMVFIITNFK